VARGGALRRLQTTLLVHIQLSSLSPITTHAPTPPLIDHSLCELLFDGSWNIWYLECCTPSVNTWHMAVLPCRAVAGTATYHYCANTPSSATFAFGAERESGRCTSWNHDQAESTLSATSMSLHLQPRISLAMYPAVHVGQVKRDIWILAATRTSCEDSLIRKEPDMCSMRALDPSDCGSEKGTCGVSDFASILRH